VRDKGLLASEHQLNSSPFAASGSVVVVMVNERLVAERTTPLGGWLRKLHSRVLRRNPRVLDIAYAPRVVLRFLYLRSNL